MNCSTGYLLLVVTCVRIGVKSTEMVMILLGRKLLVAQARACYGQPAAWCWINLPALKRIMRESRGRSGRPKSNTIKNKSSKKGSRAWDQSKQAFCRCLFLCVCGYKLILFVCLLSLPENGTQTNKEVCRSSWWFGVLRRRLFWKFSMSLDILHSNVSTHKPWYCPWWCRFNWLSSSWSSTNRPSSTDRCSNDRWSVVGHHQVLTKTDGFLTIASIESIWVEPIESKKYLLARNTGERWSIGKWSGRDCVWYWHATRKTFCASRIARITVSISARKLTIFSPGASSEMKLGAKMIGFSIIFAWICCPSGCLCPCMFALCMQVMCVSKVNVCLSLLEVLWHARIDLWFACDDDDSWNLNRFPLFGSFVCMCGLEWNDTTRFVQV